MEFDEYPIKYLCKHGLGGHSTSTNGTYHSITYDCDMYKYGRQSSMCDMCKKTSCQGFTELIVTYCPDYVDNDKCENDDIPIPSRYNIDGYDPYFVMRLWSKFDPCMSHMESIFRGNALKYLWRYRHKNGKEDLEKCIDELNKLLEEFNSEKM